MGTRNCLSSGCVRGGVGECQLVPAVFNFFSGAERGKHLWEETAESRKDKSAVPTAPSLLCPRSVDPGTDLGVRQLLFILLDATQCFSACQKVLRSTEEAAGSEQVRPISMLFCGT